MYRVPPAGPAWHAVGARLERGVRHQCARLAGHRVFACETLCFPLRATARAVAVLRVCGACQGLCMALCALLRRPQLCLLDLGCSKPGQALASWCPCSSFIRALTTSPKRAAAYFRRFGGALGYSDRPALTPALTEIRLFILAECLSASTCLTTLNGSSWLFCSRRQAHLLLAHKTVVLLMPNVRAKPAPAGKCQARAVENVPRHRPGLAFCCWGSA